MWMWRIRECSTSLYALCTPGRRVPARAERWLRSVDQSAVRFARLGCFEDMSNPPRSAFDSEVANLEKQVEELKLLMGQQPAKRPLIIEFSGSPKAGKTRSISVLELFLKRNGIKVEVFTERASVSPIKSKGHLNFNVWVSCASLQGMLEALYRDIDIFILDRSIFDALV